MTNTTVKVITTTLEGNELSVIHADNQRIEVLEAVPYDPQHTTWTYLLYTT